MMMMMTMDRSAGGANYRSPPPTMNHSHYLLPGRGAVHVISLLYLQQLTDVLP
jgi:hypothetical protein